MLRRLSLVVGMAAMLGVIKLNAQGSSTPYIVISKTQAIVGVNCIPGCPSALLTDNRTGIQAHGAALAVLTGAQPNPDWTLVTLNPGEAPFVSRHSYSLSVLHADAGGKPVNPDVLSIDTSPAAKVGPGAGPVTANLSSGVALTIPGGASPLFNYVDDAECAPENRHQLSQSIQLTGLRLDFSATKLCELNMTALSSGAIAVNPYRIGVVQGTFTKIQSSVDADTSPKKVQIGGLGNVLGDTPELDSKTGLGQTKAPANKDAAWLWIDGTVTAGTGTAPPGFSMESSPPSSPSCQEHRS